jgi:hypothetical protein
MSNNIIKFSYNWNNKLGNKAFTTIRIHNPKKYIVGNVYQIELNENPKGTAVLKSKRIIKIDQLNDFICYIDTGYNRQEAESIIQRMYKNMDLKSTLFDFCLLVYDKPNKQIIKDIQTCLEI